VHSNQDQKSPQSNMSLEEVAHIFNVDRRTLLKEVMDGKLSGHQVSKFDFEFSDADIDDYLRRLKEV
jgi:hypothetical protein